MASESRKIDGGVNVSVLEQFLLTGEVPDSTSEEDDDETASDSSWDEYSEPESVFGGNIADGTGLAQQDTTKGAKDSKVMHTVPGSYKSMLNHIPAASGRANRSSISSEREPLLQRAATMSPQGYMSDPNFIPADLPPIAEPTQRARVSPPDRNRRTFDVQPVEKQKRRRRRKRMYQEELFLDKDGFIDESYRFTFFNPAIGTVRSQELADLRTPAMDLASMIQAGGCFWIDVLRPSFQEMHLISKIFGIHALTVEDIMTQDVREKCEVHANYYLVSFRSFDADPNSESYLEPKCIYNVVMRSGIITFHMDPSVHQYHVLRRIRRQIDHIVVTPDWLNYAIIDDITDLLAPIMQMIEFEVDTIDELVLVISSSEQSDMLLRISTVRKRIMMVLRLLQGKADVVRALIKRFETATAMTTSQMNAMAGNPPLPGYAVAAADYSPRNHGSEPMAAYPIDNTDTAMEVAIDQRKGHEVLLYLGDVLDHIVTMTQNATHYDGVLGRAHANYLAQISIELTVSSNRTNDVVAKLSALAAIVVPLNFVTGMFGSNFLVPFQNYDGLAPFFTVLAMCLGFVVNLR
ncbi:CorA metal ion transporter [Linderina macrospora]|uniref:CorA metal ion transporter n=1 Tax=Linderina macrospora TaxID=4868 RepID=A0ACC1JER6_9FUNG|nr:CorA metal ion transporter [Linderina macrospora]